MSFRRGIVFKFFCVVCVICKEGIRVIRYFLELVED